MADGTEYPELIFLSLLLSREGVPWEDFPPNVRAAPNRRDDAVVVETVLTWPTEALVPPLGGGAEVEVVGAADVVVDARGVAGTLRIVLVAT